MHGILSFESFRLIIKLVDFLGINTKLSNVSNIPKYSPRGQAL